MESTKPHGDEPNDTVRLLTVREVGSRLSMSEWHVRDLIKSGRLSAVKIGKSYRISDAAINDYVGGLTANRGDA